MASTDGGARFVAYLERWRPEIDAALAQAAAGERDDALTPDLERYLYAPLAAFVAGGGKRVRPALALLGAEAVGARPACALPAAVAIERFQAAALIHDDIADNGTWRRGVACLHVSEGVGVAINVGDAALTSVFSGVLGTGSLDAELRLALLGELADMAWRTLEGQALDLGWVRDGRWDITEDDYRTMATRKTAHYSVATPLACGARCGGATTEQVEALRTFGLRVGLAFQLQDDLLNLVGDAAVQGKDFRSDITEGKRTLLAVRALAALAGSARAELLGLLSSSTTDADALARAVGMIKASGAVASVRAEARALVHDAQAALAAARIAPDAHETLASLADFCIERTR